MITVTRHLIAEIRRILKMEPTFPEVLKWDRNQPRGQKGTPTGGRWVKGVSAGTGSTPGDFSTPKGMSRQQGNAGYADIMNGPSGTGFENNPRGTTGVQALVAQAKATESAEARAKASAAQAEVLETLANGEITDSDQFGGGSNAAFKVTFEDGTKGFYKPEVGEAWDMSFTNGDINRFVKNKDFSLAEREAFAYEVDSALNLGLVPATVLRERVDDVDLSEVGGEGGGGYDSDELRSRYESYKERGQDQAYENVAEAMQEQFEEAQKEHADDIENRAEEIREIWEDEKKAYPSDHTHGSPSAQREHAALPLGSAEGFERRDVGPLPLLEVIDGAGIDAGRSLRTYEQDRVRELLRKRLEEGYRELEDPSSTEAFEHLDRDEWIQDHSDTENRLMDEQFPSFTDWRRSQGFGSGGRGGEGNSEAPHPEGGSIQQFRGNAESWGTTSDDEKAKLAVLDYVIGTMDRHSQNILYENGKLVAIDNGYSMPASREPDSFQFRSGVVGEWKSNNSEISEDIRQTLQEAVSKTDWQALVDRHPSMNAKERAAFLGRVENIKTALQTPEGLVDLWNDQQLMSW